MHWLKRFCDADVLADSEALVEALCDALVLADSEALVEALCDALLYLLILKHSLKHFAMLKCLRILKHLLKRFGSTCACGFAGTR